MEKDFPQRVQDARDLRRDLYKAYGAKRDAVLRAEKDALIDKYSERYNMNPFEFLNVLSRNPLSVELFVGDPLTYEADDKKLESLHNTLSNEIAEIMKRLRHNVDEILTNHYEI